MKVQQLRPFIKGCYMESKNRQIHGYKHSNIGEVIDQAPCCTAEEVESAIAAAKAAFPIW